MHIIIASHNPDVIANLSDELEALSVLVVAIGPAEVEATLAQHPALENVGYLVADLDAETDAEVDCLLSATGIDTFWAPLDDALAYRGTAADFPWRA